MSGPKICPLLSVGWTTDPAPCLEERCTWWDQLAGACCIAAGADYIRDVADQLDTLNRDLEQEKTALRATNTKSGDKVEQSLPDAVSTSHDNRGTEEIQA